MTKVLLICPAVPDDMPYLRLYTDFLLSANISFDVTYLNGRSDSGNYPDNYYSFYDSTRHRERVIGKLCSYYRYSRLIKSKLNKEDYSHVVIMGIACSVFFSLYLKNNFKCKYIYDIRDYSQVLRNHTFRYLNNMLLKYSYMNVISSEGFKGWLPVEYEYVLCHNTTLDRIKNGVRDSFELGDPNKIKILTIGQIRDLEANSYLIENLCNNERFELLFSGKGTTLDILEKLVIEKDYNNVFFTGKYKKEDEDSIVIRTDFINVCMGCDMVSNYLLSNRLYLSARLKKPLISFDGCYQAEIIKRYNLGVIVPRTGKISENIEEYLSSFDSERFIKGCQCFLEDVKLSMCTFNDKLQDFIESN